MMIRISFALFPLVLFLIAAEFDQGLAIHGAHAVRIPEHTCNKQVDMNICELQKCNQECSKYPVGVGECRDTTVCSCTYYCKQPPV